MICTYIVDVEFLLIFLFFHHHALTSQAYNVFIYGGCSEEKYQPNPNSSFASNLNLFLTSVVSSSSRAYYSSFGAGNGTESAIYGLYQCRGDLKVSGCTQCIQTAVNTVNLVCPNSYGVNLQLEGCNIRYEHVDFLGQLDMSLRYKRCSKSTEDEVDFFQRRDNVFTDLKSGNGFRVSSSGTVEGYVQCMGDLSVSDCTTCLAEAESQLKTLCGSAAAGEVFLTQCYARYWESGHYDIYQDSSNSDDQVGKAVAIIVGSVAGLAVLVVSLSICRKGKASRLP